jgi:hypothetical protein
MSALQSVKLMQIRAPGREIDTNRRAAPNHLQFIYSLLQLAVSDWLIKIKFGLFQQTEIGSLEIKSDFETMR